MAQVESIDDTSIESDSTWRQLIAVVWADGRPHLRVRYARDEASLVVPLAGQSLRFRTDDDADRSCVGHVPFRGTAEYHDCMRPPEDGARVCTNCAIVDATFASNLHHAHVKGSAELDPSIARHLDQPNRLYLAAFRDGSIKVGTSTRSRSEHRLAEQGAWIARFVAETTDGRTVRHLEDHVTERLGIGQSVSSTRKRRGLTEPIPDPRLDAALDEAVGRVAATLGGDASGVTGLDIRWRHPLADVVAAERIIDYPLRLTAGRHDLVLVTALGRLLIARRPDGADLFVIDPAPLFGRWLDVGDYGSDEIAIQDSLF